MIDPGDNRISINREDLLRLCESLRTVAENVVKRRASDAFAAGWLACVGALEETSAEMPSGCVLVPKDHFDGANERYDRAETTRRDAENEAAQLRAELTAVRHERDLLKEERW